MNATASRFRERIFRTKADDTLPHTITHQRTYIVPTKRGWAFLLALLLMLVTSVNYALSLGYALSFLLTGLFAATLLHTYRNIAGIQVENLVGENTFAGKAMVFTVQVSNKSAVVRHGIRLGTQDSPGIRVRVDAHGSTQARLPVPAGQRGKRHLGRLTVQSDWPLGLWTCWSYLHAPVFGLVYPTPEVDPPPLPHRADTSLAQHSIPGTQGDVSGLRDYVAGDSIGSIAWKSAARGTGLKVRTFDTERAPTQTQLSLSATGKHQVEEQLARLCAWVLAAESRRTHYSLQLPSKHLASNVGPEQMHKAMTALALHGTTL